MKYYLKDEDIKSLTEQGKINEYKLKAHKSVKDIIFSNIFTLFNTINVILAIFVLFTGQIKNLLFMVVIVINTLIGIYQELKAKRALDKLSLLVQDKVIAFRNNSKVLIYPDQIVVGEYIEVKTGDQIVCDSKVIQGSIECDESLLTGESDTITKNIGDELFSGSFVTAGSAIIRVVNVGKDNYVNKLASQAKVFRVYPSKLRDSLNYILKVASVLIVPIGLGLFYKSYFVQHMDIDTTILKIVAALVGMIAEGLILLTSVSLAVSSVNLAKKRVLVQELFCIETLARVDTLCFDKTGTLTTGNMKVVDIKGDDKYKSILGTFVRSFDEMNNTAKAISEYIEEAERLVVSKKIPFSSERKFSAIKFENNDCFILGAYEYIFKDKDVKDNAVIIKALEDAKRVLVFCKAEDIIGNKVVGEIEVLNIIILEDEIRDNTYEIFNYFKSQDVDIKIISGDNHISVLNIAKRAGLSENSKAIDVSKLSDDELVKAVIEHQVFGRVSPSQKKFMVSILKKQGHIVAMSGDGINDVLALKEADISIAMSNASPTTKQISNIVLLDGDFSNFYSILMEGRRVINNIQKVASLFLVKTFYSAGISLASIISTIKYPFIPIQLTLISTLTVGLPSFVITFEQSKQRIKDNFMRDVFFKSSIAAIRLITAIVLLYIFHIDDFTITNMIVVMTLFNGILMLGEVLRPLNRYKFILYTGIIIVSIICVLFVGEFFALSKISTIEYVNSIILMAFVFFTYKIVLYIIEKYRKRERK